MSNDDQQKLEDLITGILNDIKEPSGQGLIDANLVLRMQGEDTTLIMHLRKVPEWPNPIAQRIENEIRSRLLQAISGLSSVIVEWDANAPAPHVHSHDHGHDHSHDHGHSHDAQGSMPESPPIKHVIAVGSGKGGVGKSTVSCSLAFALKEKGYSVGIMDADVYGPSVPHMLGLKGKPEQAGNKFAPMEAGGVQVMSMGFLVDTDQAIIWRGPMLHKAVRDFLYGVAWNDLDYLIVDLPPGTGDIVLSLSQTMPIAGGVIVCTPQDVALLDARKALNMFNTVKVPCLGVVENMSYFICDQCDNRHEIFGHGGANEWSKSMALPFLGEVPINVSMRANGDAGKLSDNFLEDSPSRESLMQVADNLIASVESRSSIAVPELEVIE